MKEAQKEDPSASLEHAARSSLRSMSLLRKRTPAKVHELEARLGRRRNDIRRQQALRQMVDESTSKAAEKKRFSI